MANEPTRDGKNGPLTEREALRNALLLLVSAVEAHKQYWERVDWASEHCERRVIDALILAHKALAKDHAEETERTVDLVRFARSLGLEDSLAGEPTDG